MLADLHATCQAMATGQTTATEQMRASLHAAMAPACAHAFTLLDTESARATAARTGVQGTLLGGLSVSVKDLFDCAGQTTAAGSLVLQQSPAALHDAPAVARLKAAGAAIIGRSNMVEFAFSGVGINPHHGTPAAWDGRFDQPPGGAGGSAPRVPGGSSSGGAVSVATGAAFIALGSDTGGSIRIPAALNGIVGFKSTAARVPTAGAVPLSTTLDTVCAMTRSVRDAIAAHEVLAARVVPRSGLPLSALRLAVADTLMLDGLDAVVARAFERTLHRLSQAGARVETVPMNEIAQLATIQASGGFSPAESFAWHRVLLASQAERYDPRVRARIERGVGMKAYEYIDLLQARQAWISAMATRLQGFHAVLSPTVPITAPTIESVAPGSERDDEFFRVNGLLLRNTSVINMLDGCALSLPCHQADELPCGLMLWHGKEHDDEVLNVALQVEQALQ